jgi:hypothetical protein
MDDKSSVAIPDIRTRIYRGARVVGTILGALALGIVLRPVRLWLEHTIRAALGW